MISHLKVALQEFFVVTNKLLYFIRRELYRPATVQKSSVSEIIRA